jgi:hypothetical protein
VRRRRAGATLVLAAATGGLLAAAMAGSPIARADDPFTDIANDVQASITLGGDDYTAAGTDFSTAGDTNAGLVALFAGIDNLLVSPTDYTLLGLTAAGTDTNYSGFGTLFDIPGTVSDPSDLTAAGQEAIATADVTDGNADLSHAATFLSSGEYFAAAEYGLYGAYLSDIIAPQADLLAALFSAGF